MKKFRILVELADHNDALKPLQEGAADHELIFSQASAFPADTNAPTGPELAKVDIAFGQPDPLAIAEAAQLKWIHISSSGITRYDNGKFRALVTERNIPVTNSASVYQEACAIHALSFMLAHARKLPTALKTRAASGSPAWHSLRKSSATLRGETVLILGYGAIGQRLVELLLPFRMNVVAHRRKARGNEGVPIILSEQLPAALGMSDHIVNILPHSAETRHFINRDLLSAMKRGAIFYNIGRGATVDQDALLEALHSGRIGAAWLDVTEPEPLPNDHPLWTEPNCFITPHIAGGQPDEAAALVRHFLKNLNLFVRGEPLLDRVM